MRTGASFARRRWAAQSVSTFCSRAPSGPWLRDGEHSGLSEPGSTLYVHIQHAAPTEFEAERGGGVLGGDPLPVPKGEGNLFVAESLPPESVPASPTHPLPHFNSTFYRRRVRQHGPLTAAAASQAERVRRERRRAYLRSRAAAAVARATQHNGHVDVKARGFHRADHRAHRGHHASHRSHAVHHGHHARHHPSGHRRLPSVYSHLPTGLGGAHPRHSLAFLRTAGRSAQNELAELLIHVLVRVCAASLPTSSSAPLWRRSHWERRPRQLRLALKRIDRWSRHNMQLMGGLCISARYLLGDACVQWFGGAAFDFARSASFASFGLVYGYLPMHLIYSRLYPWLGKTVLKSLPSALKTILTLVFEFLIHIPLIYFPCFYLVSEAFQSGVSANTASAALAKYGDRFYDDNVLSMMVWGPLHGLNFFFVPLHFRIPFMSAAGILWTGVLSQSR